MNTSPVKESLPTVREQFEAWARKEGMLLRRVINGHGYMDVDTHGAWSGWNGALQAIAAPREGWQPIETAPKDRTPIDIWRAGERCVNMSRVDLGNGNVFYEPVESGPCCVRDATDWMALPEAPAAPLAVEATEK